MHNQMLLPLIAPGLKSRMAEELWDTLPCRGLSEFAPLFVKCRVLAVPEILVHRDALVGSGVPLWALDLASRGSSDQGTAVGRAAKRRSDFPTEPS